MMYGYGDGPAPLDDTIEIVDDMLKEYIAGVVSSFCLYIPFP